MKVALAGFAHESNSFSSQPTALEDFTIHEGADVLAHQRGTYHEIAGYISAAENLGMTLCPVLAAYATPSGPVTSAAYEDIADRIVAGIDGLGQIDGVLLALHGAMVADDYPHADAETVCRVRALVGPDVPIAVTHDYHANVPPELVEAADVLIVYKTNPHIDQRERGVEATTILARTIQGEIKPTMALTKPPVVFNIYFHNTSVVPVQPLMQQAIELEHQPGILSCSFAAGYQYADVPWMGPAVVVVTDNDQDRAEAEASRLAEEVWAVRDGLILDVPDPATAVAQAMASDMSPVTLLDFGDNIGGGSVGDSTFVLQQLLENDAHGWVVTLWDPAAAQACFDAGTGASIALHVGGKTDKEHGTPQSVTGTVRTLSDGSYEERERRHGGGLFHNQGKTAVVRVASGQGAGLLVLNSRRVCPNSIHQITSVGIAPEQQKILVAKGAIAPRAAYEPISPQLIEVDSGGACWIGRGPEHYQRARKDLYEWTR